MAHLGADGTTEGGEAFWTACSHCCYVHSYPRPYLGRRLRCPTPACRHAFPATELAATPPVVPGTDMYFCTWAFFPLGPPVVADGWKPFTPFHPFNTTPPSPSPSPAPFPAPSTATPIRASPTSSKKVGVCLKGRARAEAEEEEAATVGVEAEAFGDGENFGSGTDINETVDLGELGFRVDEMGVLHDLP
jgi:hypothetical protein